MQEAAAIMAAGKGTRMGTDLPKVAHVAAGKTLVRWAVEACQAAGIERIVVIVGYREEVVRAELADLPVEFAVQAEQKGTGHAALQARQVLGDTPGRLFVLNGDMPFIDGATLSALRAEHERSGADMVLTTVMPAAPLEYGRVIRDADGAVQGIIEERDCTPEQAAVRELNIGFYVFETPGIWSVLEGLSTANAQGEMYITDTAAAYARAGGRVAAVQVPERIGLGVNTTEQLAAMDALLREVHGLPPAEESES